MDLQVLPVLSAAEVRSLVDRLSQAAFVDGKITASGAAQRVKSNLQVQRDSFDCAPLDAVIFQALQRNEDLQSFAYPKRIHPPTYSRYEPGMHYGWHVDSAVIGAPRLMRADLAMTIFLSPPDTYEGGELVVEFPLGEQEIKLNAGEAIVYPATTMHRVAPVTQGFRLAVVTWMQCAVRDERLRSVLSDLNKAVKHTEAAGDAEQLKFLSKCYHNLLRYAADL